MKVDTVFISGSFVSLHLGHFRLFRFAKDIGKRLVVGLNAIDTRLRDPSLIERMSALDSIDLIDQVLIVEPDLASVLTKLRPDIVLKGAEYKKVVNLESKLVSKWGGRVIFGSGEGTHIIEVSSSSTRPPKFLNNLVFPEEARAWDDTSPEELKQIVSKFSNLSVLVIGDLIVDEYIDCDALGMSREDPTIVVAPRSSTRFIGGAGIVAAHGQKLGAKSRYIAITGFDESAEYADSVLSHLNVQHYLIKDETRPTTTKRRYRSEGKTLLRVNQFRQHDPPKSITKSILNLAIDLIEKSDVLIFSDFNYGCLPENLTNTLIKHAKRGSIFCAADSQSSSQIGNVARFWGMGLISCTEYEARLALSDQRSGLSALGVNLAKRTKASNLILKLGASGVLLVPPNIPPHKLQSIPSVNKNPKDVAGAGDSLLIASSLSLACGASLRQAGVIGSIAAGLQTSRIGNMPLDQADLVTAIGDLAIL